MIAPNIFVRVARFAQFAPTFKEVLMNTKQKLHQIKLQQWATRFQEQASSGLTVRAWCAENNLTIHTYNYWKHKLNFQMNIRYYKYFHNSSNSSSILISILSSSLPLNVHASETGSTRPSLAK